MIDFANLEMTPMEGICGGNGIIFVSPNFVAGNTVMSAMIVPPGSSIGLHEHLTKDGVTEVYQVLNGDAPKINGVRTKVAVCQPGESHDLVNDTETELTVLSIKSK